jgi:hypothetical protein
MLYALLLKVLNAIIDVMAAFKIRNTILLHFLNSMLVYISQIAKLLLHSRITSETSLCLIN